MTIEYKNSAVIVPRTFDIKRWTKKGAYPYHGNGLQKTRVTLTPGKTSNEDAVVIDPGFVIKGPAINRNDLCKEFGIHWSNPEEVKERNPYHW